MLQGQQNWTYSHTGHAYPIIHVFLHGDKKLNDFPVLKQKLQIIQDVECNNHLKGGILNLYNLTDTSWIIATQKMGFRYACIWFEGTWPATDDFNMNILQEIDRFNETEWLVAGQISNEDEYYPHFAKSFMVLNMTRWEECSSPNPYINPNQYPAYFNINARLNPEDSMYAIKRVSNNESSQRNWWTVSAGASLAKGPKVHKHFGDAWIPWSLKEHFTVWGLSDDIMDKVSLTKPHIQPREFEQGLMGKKYDSKVVSYQARKLIERTFRPTSPVYFVNTEPSRPNTARQLHDTEFEQYVGASAGFKLLYYAYKYGVNPASTKFTWFDFDADSCQFKRDTLKHWDGRDYPRWVSEWCDSNPKANDSLRGIVRERWPGIVDQFGGDESWQDYWAQISACNYEVIQCDLIHDHDTIIKKLNPKRTFFWGSNIYSYIIPKLLAGQFELETSFMSLIKKLHEVNDDSWYSGTDLADNDLMCPVRAILSATENRSLGYE
jgi:hypothetical protein